MLTITYIAFILLGIYSLLILSFAFGWQKIKPFNIDKSTEPIPISIVIACRNEEKTITQLLTSLIDQNYPKEKAEIIIVDDHSEDETTKIIEEFIEKNNHIKLLKLPEGKKGKKEALNSGIQNANSNVVITTDADCTMHKNWITVFVDYYIHHTCKIISGPVVFNHKNTFQKLQTLEFLSLVGSGAGAIGVNKPIMNNGANLLFEKSLFLESNQHKSFISGDDIFLMLHAKRKYNNAVHFLKSKDAIVFTQPVVSLKDFINQRMRWTSKSKAYRDFDMVFTALIVSFVNAMFATLLVFSFFNKTLSVIFLLFFAIKSVIDLSILIPVSRFFNQLKLLWYFIPLQIIYPFYISFTVILGLTGKFQWKNRSFKEKR